MRPMLSVATLHTRRLLLPNLTLLQRFMILCAVVLLGTAIVLGERMSANVQRDMLRSTAFNTALYVSSVVGSELERADATLWPTVDNLRLLDLLFSPERLGTEIVAIKVWSKEGEVVYSSERDLIGRRFPIERDLAEALQGEVEYEISDLHKEENVLERARFSRLLEVYAPIRSRHTGQVIGVSEVYQRVDNIPEFISSSRREVWLLTGAAFLILYITLSGIVRSATRTIASQHQRLQEANQALQEYAVTDFATRLYNHRYFQDRLLEEVQRATRGQQPLSLLFCDLDYFKSLNDRYGHPSGDQVLRSVADIIKGTIRSTDIAARYGGDEFALILINTDRAGALTIAERLRRIVETTRVATPDGHQIQVTVSIGIASFPADAPLKELLIKQADQAMFVAKNLGRNRVVECAPVA